MCSPSPKRRPSRDAKSPVAVPQISKASRCDEPASSPASPSSPSCWRQLTSRSRSAARRLVKKYRHRRNCQMYTVNTKQSIREAYFRRLKSHVPAMSSKENPTKLEVILEAISYIQRLKRDLESGLNNNEDALSSTLKSPTKAESS